MSNMQTSSNGQSGCLLAIFKVFGINPSSGKGGDEPLPYRQRDDFLSPAELSFYRVLTQIIADKAIICPKVRVGDILFVAHPNENLSYINRINQKHVDFVLCDPTSMRPLGVVELDDASHGRSDRQSRDEFVDRAFEAAAVPIVHVPAQRAYRTTEVVGLVAPILHPQAPAEVRQSAAALVNPSPTPTCPKCGVPMVLRTAKRGDKAGEQFWGCSKYPKCREVAAATT